MSKFIGILAAILVVVAAVVIVIAFAGESEPFSVTILAVDAKSGEPVQPITVDPDGDDASITTMPGGDRVKIEFPGGSEGAFTVKAEGYEPYEGRMSGDGEVTVKLVKIEETPLRATRVVQLVEGVTA